MSFGWLLCHLFRSVLAIVNLWHHAIKPYPQLWFLRSIKQVPYCLWSPVHCMCSSCACTNTAPSLLTTFCNSRQDNICVALFPQCHLALNPESCQHLTLLPLSLVWTTMHPVKGSNINHFTNIRPPKNVTLTKRIAGGLAIIVFDMVHWSLKENDVYNILQYMMWHGSQTSHIPCSLHNLEVSKQTIIFHILIVYTCISYQMKTNYFDNSSNLSKQFH